MDEAVKLRLAEIARKKRGRLLKDVTDPAEWAVAVDHCKDHGPEIKPWPLHNVHVVYLRYATPEQVAILRELLPSRPFELPIPHRLGENATRPVVLFQRDVLLHVLKFLVSNREKYVSGTTYCLP